jgi:alkylation response protein AidB-like acyl-CoA dehydrogenase
LMEELGRVCTSTVVTVGAHIGIGAMAIYVDGTEAQKNVYLRPLARGEKIAAFALTEAQAGSDAAGIRTRAVRAGSDYILNGCKLYITNGPLADVFVVLAVTDPALGARGGVTAFVVEAAWPGVKVGTVENKMGIRGSATSELVFEEVRVPRENVLGQVGLGFVTFMKTLDLGRITVGGACLGGAQAALEAAVQWAATRRQFGAVIATKQSIQWMVADMATEIEALRALVYRTAWLVDSGQLFSREAAMVKLYGSEVASRAIDKALQIHGAVGYCRAHPMERAWRDARIAEIFEGTNEIQRIVIASELFQELGVRLRP